MAASKVEKTLTNDLLERFQIILADCAALTKTSAQVIWGGWVGEGMGTNSRVMRGLAKLGFEWRGLVQVGEGAYRKGIK